jgi:hypothetical protein
VLPEPRLVLVIGPDALARVLDFELSQTLRQLVFLKAASAAGSVSG